MRKDWWRFWIAKVDGPEYVTDSVSITVVFGVKCYTIGYRKGGWRQ